MTAATGKEIRPELQREFPFTCERVFAALTQPDQLMHWMGPPGVTNLDAIVNLSVGGRYRITMKGMNDGPVYVVSGEYREIAPPHRLRFSWKWEHSAPEEPAMEVTFDLSPTAAGCRLALTQTGFPSQEECDRHTHGWNGSFDRLSKLGD